LDSESNKTKDGRSVCELDRGVLDE
jgi:hypothetical protein